MIKKLIGLTAIIFTINFCNAQYKSVPGYMGVKNCVSLGTKHHIIFNDENFIQNLVFQPSIELTFDRTLNRRSSIGLTFGNHNFTIKGNSAMAKFEFRSNLIIDVDGEAVTAFTLDKGNTKFTNNYFTFFKTYFMKKRGAIAPMGKYFKLGVTANFYKIKEDNNIYNYQDPNTEKQEEFKNSNTTWNTEQLYVANFEFGNRTFLSNNIFFNKSIGLNFPVNFYTTVHERFYQNESDYNEQFVKYYFTRMQAFNLNFSLGYAF